VTRRPKDIFQFKHFLVKHDKCAHKVGTDGVLLGAWANAENTKRILDIGTGTGVIALMMAQRTHYDVHIDAIDIAAEDYEQARENFALSRWAERMVAHHTALQSYQAQPYDLIVSNPPFFIDSAKPPLDKRIRARHTETLAPEELLTHSIRLLQPNGKLAIILPPAEGKQLITLANLKGLHCVRTGEFFSRAHKPLERLLLEFQFQNQSLQTDKIILYEKDDIWTDKYRQLTQNFYLKT
jgi:tRNA1Val (adenine37-N6)-methyltransferase